MGIFLMMNGLVVINVRRCCFRRYLKNLKNVLIWSHRPFMREQLKITEPDKIEYWRANEIRDEFMNVFTSNHLIE